MCTGTSNTTVYEVLYVCVCVHCTCTQCMYKNVTYFDSTDNEMRRIERNKDNDQNQHQVEIQLPVKVSRTVNNG